MANWIRRRRHLSMGLFMLLASDAEQSPAAQVKRRRAQAHADQCARCRKELDQLIRLKQDIATLTAEGLFDALSSEPLDPTPVGAPRPRWWPVATALLASLLIGIVLSRGTAVVQADALVAQQVARERTQSADLEQRVHVSLTPESEIERTAAVPTAGFAAEWTLRNGQLVEETSHVPIDAAQALRPLFARHHLDLRRPLSATRIQAWRASLSHKRDHVTRSGERRILRTTTTGELRELVLTVRGDRVVRVTITFAGVGRFDCEEIQQWVRTTPPGAPPPAPAPRVIPPRQPETATPPASAGEGIPAPSLPPWLSHRLARDPQRATFVPSLLRRLVTIEERLTTLQRLARRDAGARDRRVERHYDALIVDLVALDHQLTPIVGALSQCELSAHLPTDWPQRTAAALAQMTTLSRQVERVLRRDAPPADEEAQALGATFNGVWRVGACR